MSQASVRVEDEDDDMRDGPGGEAQARGLNVGSAEEMFDILEDVERLGGALAELPHQLSPASQQDPLIPYHKGQHLPCPLLCTFHLRPTTALKLRLSYALRCSPLYVNKGLNCRKGGEHIFMSFNPKRRKRIRQVGDLM